MGFLDRIKGGKTKAESEDTVDVVETVDADVVEEQKPKKKGLGSTLSGLFGRNKQEKGIIELMGLNEAVASMGLSVLEEIADSDQKSAVRALDLGYTAIAITEKMFQDLKVDVSSADFGSFANAIASEHIESILLENDLHNGVLVLIPNRNTLDILEEFSFIENIAYKWALIPYDIEDDSTAILLDNNATLGDLNVISDEDMHLALQNGIIVASDEALAVPDDTEELPEEFVDESLVIGSGAGADDDHMFDDDDDDVFGDLLVDTPELSVAPAIDSDDPFADMPGEDFDPFGDIIDDSAMDSDVPFADMPMDDSDDFDPFSVDDFSSLDDMSVDELDGFDDIDEFEEADEPDDIDMLIDDVDDNDDYQGLQTVSEGQEMIEGVLDREFHNDELGLAIAGDAFNQQFGDVNPITFDTEPMDDGVLAQTIVEMRRDANTRLKNVHNKNMQQLRSVYQNGLSEIHDNLVNILDYRDASTAFGERFEELELFKEDQLERADELVARNREKLDQQYDRDREDFGDRARREAMAKYDDQYGDKHDERKRELGAEVESNIVLEFDGELSELYEERREVAKRIFDQMTTGLLIRLQEIHEDNMSTEQELYEQFHENMDKYTRENYTDEVIRAKALATQLRQHHEAEDVRKQYEQMIATNQRELAEVEARAESEVRRLENSQSKAIKESVAEYKRQVVRREEEISELRRDRERLQDKIVAIGNEKDDEFSLRLRASEQTIEGQRHQLAYEQERAENQGRQSIVLLAGMAIVGVAIGLIIGFVVANKPGAPADVTPASTAIVQEFVDTTALTNALDVTFNQMFPK